MIRRLLWQGRCGLLSWEHFIFFSMRDVSLTYPLANSLENSSIVSRVEKKERMIQVKVRLERILHFYNFPDTYTCSYAVFQV